MRQNLFLFLIVVALSFSLGMAMNVSSHSNTLSFKTPRTSQTFTKNVYDDENPIELFKHFPKTFKSYINANGKFILDEFDNMHYADNGKTIMRKDILENDSTIYIYDKNNNIREIISFEDGKTIDYRKVFNYDSILEKYQIQVTEYGYEDGVVSRFYQVGREIIRDKDNKIKEIKSYSISNTDPTPYYFQKFIPIYQGDTAIKCYMIEFDKSDSDTTFYTDLKWHHWTGQITENDVLTEGSSSFNIESSLRNKYSFMRLYHQDDDKKYVYQRQSSPNIELLVGYLEEPIETERRMARLYWEKLDNNGSYREEWLRLLINDSDTSCYECMLRENNYDEQENLIKSQRSEKSDYKSDYELKYIGEMQNIYDSQNRLIGYKKVKYDENDLTLFDTVEKGELIYSGLSNEKPSVEKVGIYPNPVKDILHFSAKGSFDKISIYNSVGKKVHSATVTNSATVANTNTGEGIGNNSGSCNVSLLPPGIYILELLGKNQIAIGKFIK